MLSHQSSSSRRRFVDALAASGGAAILSPVSQVTAAADLAGAGTFVVAMDADAPTLNPIVSQVIDTFTTCNQMYDTLTKYDVNFQPIPWLAKSWTISSMVRPLSLS
jgi:ABC-type transport system substrate-binding protein